MLSAALATPIANRKLTGINERSVNDKLEGLLRGIGLKAARQNYTYEVSGSTYSGQNIYAVLQAPRGDATEAIVLVAPWRNMEGEVNRQGIPLTLTLARYIKRTAPPSSHVHREPPRAD